MTLTKSVLLQLQLVLMLFDEFPDIVVVIVDIGAAMIITSVHTTAECAIVLVRVRIGFMIAMPHQLSHAPDGCVIDWATRVCIVFRVGTKTEVNRRLRPISFLLALAVATP